MKTSAKDQLVKMGLPTHWRNLHPGLQHTLAGDLVLSNQFDSLVGMNERGMIVPMGAKSWEINDDFTEFTFKINTGKKFSDGTHLSASDFKKSWEKAFALESISSNSSLLDVLYKIKGFSEFKSKNTISGIEVISDEILKIHFTSPFRMALDHLTGNRFSAFKQVGDKFIGTGSYVIEENGVDELFLYSNPYSEKKRSDINLRYIPPNQILQKLEDKEIDCIPHMQGTILGDQKFSDKISIIYGQDASHLALNINNLRGRLFHDPKMRRGFQFFIWTRVKEGALSKIDTPYLIFDPQVYMEAQMGRLSKEEINQILVQQANDEKDFSEITKSKPLIVIANEGAKSTFEVLKKIGIRYAENSRIVDQKTFATIVYKDFEPDILIASFSIANGDPDGIYHRLGKNGAILSPMSFSKSVSDLLEEGRKIIKTHELDEHYKTISREIIKDVPFVHLGFTKDVALVRNDIVKFNDSLLRRNEGHFDVFELK